MAGPAGKRKVLVPGSQNERSAERAARSGVMTAVDAATASEMAEEASVGAKTGSRRAAATHEDQRGHGVRQRKVSGRAASGGEEGDGGGGVGVRAAMGSGRKSGGLGSWTRWPVVAGISPVPAMAAAVGGDGLPCRSAAAAGW